MVTKFTHYWLAIVLLSVIAMPIKTNAGMSDDIKKFITTNKYYNHGLTIATALISYGFFKQLIRSKRFNVDNSVAIVLAFIGSYCISKLAEEHPGYTTVGGLSLATLKYLEVINSRL